jgi:phosphate starvation-inducible PhoH-like protein
MSKRKSRYATKNNIHRIGFHVIPKNEKQDKLIRSIKVYPITVTIGCAGTGKTFCSAGTVAHLYQKGGYEKIVITRANVPTGKSLGHFPGTIQEKMTPWLLPMLEVFERAFCKEKYKYMINKGEIEIQPIETIRGRSYENSLVLVDEAQNLSIDELKAQSDVRKGQDLLKFCALIKKNHIPLPVVKFTVDDIVRSDIVADLVRMFIKEKL